MILKGRNHVDILEDVYKSLLALNFQSQSNKSRKSKYFIHSRHHSCDHDHDFEPCQQLAFSIVATTSIHSHNYETFRVY